MRTHSTAPAAPPFTPSSPIRHYAQGLMMGGADVIPGVSGGTVALIIGIYEAVIASIQSLASAIVHALRGDIAGGRERFGQVYWRLILPLVAGIGTALVIGSVVLPPLLDRYPSQSSALFFGLIAGSLSVPWRRIEMPKLVHIGIAVLAAVIAFALVGLPPREVVEPGLLQVFLSASIAICAMILPGVSGAFLLLVLGIYETTLDAVRSLNLAYVAAFGIGAVLGLGLFSKLLGILLDRYHGYTMAALVGLMAGSLRALWPWLDENRRILAPPADAGQVVVVILLALAGFIAVSALTRFGAATEDADLTPDTE